MKSDYEHIPYSNDTQHFYEYYHIKMMLINSKIRKIKKQYEDVRYCYDRKVTLITNHITDKQKKARLLQIYKVSLNKINGHINHCDELLANEKNRYCMPLAIYSYIINKYFKLLLKKIYNGYKYKILTTFKVLGLISITTKFVNDKGNSINWAESFKKKQELFDKGVKPHEIKDSIKYNNLYVQYIKEGYTETDAGKLANIMSRSHAYLIRYEPSIIILSQLKLYKNTFIENMSNYGFKVIHGIKKVMYNKLIRLKQL